MVRGLLDRSATYATGIMLATEGLHPRKGQIWRGFAMSLGNFIARIILRDSKFDTDNLSKPACYFDVTDISTHFWLDNENKGKLQCICCVSIVLEDRHVTSEHERAAPRPDDLCYNNTNAQVERRSERSAKPSSTWATWLMPGYRKGTSGLWWRWIVKDQGQMPNVSFSGHAIYPCLWEQEREPLSISNMQTRHAC